MLYILDYGAGNVRSLVNTIKKLGYEYKWVETAEDIDKADKLLFPGVGAYGQAMASLREKGYADALTRYIKSGRPFFGICIGMQVLFESSTESPDQPGLGVIPGQIGKFDSKTKSVPHMGWNGATTIKRRIDNDSNSKDSLQYGIVQGASYYFVHSFRVSWSKNAIGSSNDVCPSPLNGPPTDLQDWVLALTEYGDESFVSVVQRGNVLACQFHPEKSGSAGLHVLNTWLAQSGNVSDDVVRTIGRSDAPSLTQAEKDELEDEWKKRVCGPMKANGFAKRIVACLDVRANDAGDLVVTKGDQYDVREQEDDKEAGRQVRNLGKPVDLAKRYYEEGADEIAFLNITSFRSCPLNDQPMLDVVRKSAETIFVPLTIGGGIRDTVDPDGTKRSAFDVASAYFRSGADKVSIGSDAVYVAEKLIKEQPNVKSYLDIKGNGDSGIEGIFYGYGAQAVVISVDPRRVYANSLEEIPQHHRDSAVDLLAPNLPSSYKQSPKTNLLTSPVEADPGPEGQRYCWYQCTVSGGRETRDIDVVQLAQVCEALGAGEILLNSVDKDGAKSGFDHRLIHLVSSHVTIPVVASSGAGAPQHFNDVFEKTNVEAALAAGIFHRKEVPISDVKQNMMESDISTRHDLPPSFTL